MSITYNVVSGDSFSLIARKKYGDDQRSDLIARANPGVSEPLIPGTQLTIPPVAENPTDQLIQSDPTQRNKTTVLINGSVFEYWTNVRISRSMDVIDTIEMTTPFDVNAPGFKETFKPLSFASIIVIVGGEPLFTGTMINITPSLTATSKTLAVSGYGLAGVLNDCTPSSNAFPVEFNDQGLIEISQSLTTPFGVPVEFEAGQGAIFERVACEPQKRVLVFLTELAHQRNLITTSTSKGSLLFHKENETVAPVARLAQGEPSLISVLPFFEPQSYYSDITGLEPVIVGLAGSKYTERNTRLNGVVRPLTFMVTDTVSGDVQTAVKSKIGRMFGNAISYQIGVSTWRDSNGELWKPNTFITLNAPDAMIYKDYIFLIRSVDFNASSKSETATLTLVLPGSFSGKVPESLPWDE